MQDIILLRQKAADAISQAQDVTALETIRVEYLGKKAI